LASTALARPVLGVASTPSGGGYWLVAEDGGAFAEGDAHFSGSLAGTARCTSRVVGLVAGPDVAGYSVIASDGTATTFGS
jgi:hypothetical protein